MQTLGLDWRHFFSKVVFVIGMTTSCTVQLFLLVCVHVGGGGLRRGGLKAQPYPVLGAYVLGNSTLLLGSSNWPG